MATVSGRLLFDRARAANPPAGMAGIANVSVVLQNAATNESLAVLTDINGNYSFINVPDGSYRIVEAFGTMPAFPAPGDFTNAMVTGVVTAVFPPVSLAPNPPPGATNLDGVSRNTIPITVSGNQDVINQFILNGPVTYTPIEVMLDPCVTVSPANLITDAFNGTMGSFPPGTPVDTSVPAAPFPQNVPNYTYVLTRPGIFVPDAQQYTVQNILTNTQSTTIGAWWRIADHTAGNETGRMMVVNGDITGSVFFTTTVNVTPDTNYLFSSWILNMFKATGYAGPRLGVVILGEAGQELFRQTLGALIPVNTSNPEWRQIGTVINSGDNSALTVQFLNEAPEAIGNDYAIDDISLQEIDIPAFVPVKSINTNTASVGERVIYTVTLTNTCQSPLVNVQFTDILPNGLIFAPDTVTVNGVSVPSVNPNDGITVPNISGGETATITFEATVTNVPAPNPAVNTASISYQYTPVEGGILGDFSEISNEVPLNINPAVGEADLEAVKTVFPATAEAGEMVEYTIIVTNNGPTAAEDVILADIFPAAILFPIYSLDGGASFDPWPGQIDLGGMALGEVITVIVRGEVSPDEAGTFTNSTKVTSSTPDPNPVNNTSSAPLEVLPNADIAVTKAVSPAVVISGQLLTYTINITNNGPSEAENVVLTDITTGLLTDAEFSLNGGAAFSPWTGSFNIGNLLDNGQQTVIIRGIVEAPSGQLVFENVASVLADTPDPNLANNEAAADVFVQPEADVVIVKSPSPAAVSPGETLTYTLNVVNSGPNTADRVLVTDIIEPGTLLGPQFSVDGTPMGAWPTSYNLGDMIPGESHTIAITGTVAPNVGVTISNIATVLAETSDPNLNNNSSEAEIAVEQEPCVVEEQQLIDICVPVSVTPFAEVGIITTICCGEPVIEPGVNICPGTPGGSCDFTITQRICVTVPVTFGADVETGEVQTLCVEGDCGEC